MFLFVVRIVGKVLGWDSIVCSVIGYGGFDDIYVRFIKFIVTLVSGRERDVFYY